MSYFKTSSVTVQHLARNGYFEDVAGFLVLARHATGFGIGGYEPYTLSGAGVNSIHEKAGVSEETARGVIERLQSYGVIRPAAADEKNAFGFARWVILQGALDLSLPHAFTDGLKRNAAVSPLRRVRAVKVDEPYISQMADISANELRLDALMVLLHVYMNTRMEDFGGLNPQCAYRSWTTKSQTEKASAIRWGAEPAKETSAYWSFTNQCMQHVVGQGSKTLVEAARSNRFWNAWRHIKGSGLVYEAVTLFDVPPGSNASARAEFTLRVNDFHADTSPSSGDPSLLKYGGGATGYYTPADNNRSEQEAMWVLLPDKRGELVGIWRPRFRAETPDVGAWIDKERTAIGEVLESLEKEVDDE